MDENPSSCETPFWVTIRSGKDWEQKDYFLKAFQRFPASNQDKKWGLHYLALFPPLYSTLDEIVVNLKDQILAYINVVEETRINAGIILEES